MNGNQKNKIDEEKNEIFSNTNYLKWLETFTKEHQSFVDSDWLYSSEKISKEDNENVSKLHLLYEGIELYAKNHHIYPINCNFWYYYNIKLDNICYEIGVLTGKRTIFICNRMPLQINIQYIDFNDIINDKKKDNNNIITQQLKELSDKVLELYNKDVPLTDIKETFNHTLEGIKKNNYTRKLNK